MFGYIKLCGKQKTTYEPRNQWDSPIIYKDHNKNVNPVEQIIVGSEKINKYIYIEREREREGLRKKNLVGILERGWSKYWWVQIANSFSNFKEWELLWLCNLLRDKSNTEPAHPRLFRLWCDTMRTHSSVYLALVWWLLGFFFFFFFFKD